MVYNLNTGYVHPESNFIYELYRGVIEVQYSTVQYSTVQYSTKDSLTLLPGIFYYVLRLALLEVPKQSTILRFALAVESDFKEKSEIV